MYVCRVCGFDQLKDKQYIDDIIPSFSICPCCGFESGYDDLSNELSISDYRKKWIENGAKWWSKRILPPTEWDGISQLNNALNKKIISK